MKLTALLLLFAIIGKMSAVPVRYPVRLAYYRAAPALQEQEQPLDDDADDDEEADVSDEVNFSSTPIQDDDDDSEEQEEPPQFQKLFPLPQRNSPGHNFPLSIMMGEISAQGWKVPKGPQGQQQQQREARDAIRISRDDDDDDSDEDDDEEDEEDDEDTEDDLPEWNTLFPNLEAEANAGPPADLVDTSTQPELPASYRSGLGGPSRVVYVPARSFRQLRRPSPQTVSRQYVLRNPSPPRSQVVYTMASPSYMNRRQQQPVIQRRPQQVIYSAQQPMRRQQQPYVMYMPVRRNNYSPYVSPYVPRYRY